MFWLPEAGETESLYSSSRLLCTRCSLARSCFRTYSDHAVKRRQVNKTCLARIWLLVACNKVLSSINFRPVNYLCLFKMQSVEAETLRKQPSMNVKGICPHYHP